MIKWSYRFFAKIFIVVIYLASIALVLYAPLLYNLFFVGPQEIVVYTSRETFRLEKFKEFEEKTGIHVRVTYFNTNEDMFAKFKINRGFGYDLVVTSDYMVEHLVKSDLLQKLDVSKISNFSQIDKRLLGKYYDPENRYSLPLFWIPYGIGFDRKFFGANFENEVSWDVVFHKQVLARYGDYKIAMPNDAREAVFLGAIYLFGKVEGLTDKEFEKVKDLLIAQKPIIEAYGETTGKYLLLSGIVPLIVTPASRMKEINDLKRYGFAIPKEGGLIDLINIGIPTTSKKSALAHKLIDFLLSKDVGAYNFNELSCNPANKESYQLIQREYFENKSFFPDDDKFRCLFLLNNQISPALLEKIWFLIKSA